MRNIYKYYIAYKLAAEMQAERRQQRELLKVDGSPKPEQVKARAPK